MTVIMASAAGATVKGRPAHPFTCEGNVKKLTRQEMHRITIFASLHVSGEPSAAFGNSRFLLVSTGIGAG